MTRSKTHTDKFARRCSVSGQGMNEGWCWGDGESYTKYEKDTLAVCRKDRAFILFDLESITMEDIQDGEKWFEFSAAIGRAKAGTDTDEDLLNIGYQTGYVYFTDWHDDEYTEDTWYTHDGKFVDGNEVQTINDNTL